MSASTSSQPASLPSGASWINWGLGVLFLMSCVFSIISFAVLAPSIEEHTKLPSATLSALTSAFFFMTCWAKWRHIGDLDLPGLRRQLATTLFVICIFSIIGALVAEAIVKFGLWWEIREYRKKFDKEPPPRMELEEQAKYGAIGPKEEVMTTMPLMIALGYVLLFGGVCYVIIVSIHHMYIDIIVSFLCCTPQNKQTTT